MLNPAVTKWIEHIKQDPRCVGTDLAETAIGRLVALVEKRLLVVTLNLVSKDLNYPSGNIVADNQATAASGEYMGDIPKIVVQAKDLSRPSQVAQFTDTENKGRAYAIEVFNKLDKIIQDLRRGIIQWLNYRDGLDNEPYKGAELKTGENSVGTSPSYQKLLRLPPLIDQLEEDGLRESDIDGKMFVPLDYLEKIFNKKSIEIELGLTDGAYTKAKKPSDLLDRITKEAKKIFGALVLMGKANAIEDLLEEGLTDDHLPLSCDPKHDAILSRDGETLFQLGFLGRQTITEFIKHKQWLFLAPILDTNCELIEFDYECALPFTDSEIIGHGAVGIVHRAKIYPGHQRGFEVC